MNVVLDTNIIFQGLYSDKGASHKILSLVRSGAVTLLISNPVLAEYEEVLKKNHRKLHLDAQEVDSIIHYFAYIGKPVLSRYLWRPNLQDEDDNIFVELALNGNADRLVTQNIRDFTRNNELKYINLTVSTPADFVRYWREKHET